MLNGDQIMFGCVHCSISTLQLKRIHKENKGYFLLLLIQYMPNSMAGKMSESVTCHIMQMTLNLELQ